MNIGKKGSRRHVIITETDSVSGEIVVDLRMLDSKRTRQDPHQEQAQPGTGRRSVIKERDVPG